jgi:cbb3-type cytochrome oxidase cytochrome c subunit
LSHFLYSYAEVEQDRLQAEAIAIQSNLAKQIAEQGQQQAEAIADQERLAKQEAEAISTQERQEKLQERQQKERLVAYLRSLGINPDEI